MVIAISALLLAVAFVLQSTIFTVFSIGGVVPDVLLVLVVALSLSNGPAFGGKLGFAAGLLLDVQIGMLLGLNAVVKLIVGLVIGHGAERFFKDNFFVPVMAVFFATWLNQLLYYGGSWLSGVPVPSFATLWRMVWPLSLYNAAIMVLLYSHLYDLSRHYLRSSR